MADNQQAGQQGQPQQGQPTGQGEPPPQQGQPTGQGEPPLPESAEILLQQLNKGEGFGETKDQSKLNK